MNEKLISVATVAMSFNDLPLMNKYRKEMFAREMYVLSTTNNNFLN